MSEEVSSIFSQQLETEQVELGIDTEADAFDSGPPPPDGEYVAAVSVADGEKGWQEYTDKSGNKYYACSLENRLVVPGDPKLDDRLVFDNFVSTMVMRNTGTCAVAGVSKALGAQVESRATALDLARQLTEVTTADPKCRIVIRWEAQGKTGVVKENGKDEYKTVLTGMVNFPRKPDDQGGEVFAHLIHWSPISGQHGADPFDGSIEVRARASVVRYKPLEES